MEPLPMTLVLAVLLLARIVWSVQKRRRTPAAPAAEMRVPAQAS
jgi:hypothetical protein